MDVIVEAEKIINETESLSANSLRLSRLLGYPEISADRQLYKHLLKQYSKTEKACALRASILALYNNGNPDNPDQITSLTDELRAELIRLGDDGTPAVEIAVYGDNDCKNILLKSFCAIYRKSGCVCEMTSDGLTITGTGAYSALKDEVGIHRFRGKPAGEIRLFAYPLNTSKPYDEKEVKIDVFHSDGAGGQNVNKVETAIRATHLPTGITVTCRDERSQLQNKRRALSLLEEKVVAFKKKEFDNMRAEEQKLQSKTNRIFSYTDGQRDL